MTGPAPAVIEAVASAPADQVPTLSVLLDPAAVVGVLKDAVSRAEVTITGCRVEYVRYDPRSSCTVSYSVDYLVRGREGTYSARLYVRAFDDKEARGEGGHVGRSWVPGALLDVPVQLPRQKAVLYEFPNDARLEHLAAFTQPATLSGIMQRIASDTQPGLTVSQRRLDLRLLRYKPESRCILFCEVDCDPVGGAPARSLAVVMRTAKRGRVEATQKTLSALFSLLRPDAPLHVPRPVYCDSKLHIAAVEWVAGEKLSDLWVSTQGESVLRQTGRALACLHGLDVSQTDVRRGSGLESRKENSLALLETSTPEVSRLVAAVRKQFEHTQAPGAPRREALIHGDFHQGQVLIRAGAAWFIDFDNSGTGEVEQDLGNFVAQVRWLELLGRLPAANAIARTLLDSYRDEAGISPDLRRIRLWCAVGLVELAAKQYRRLKPDWPKTVPVLLKAAESQLVEQ